MSPSSPVTTMRWSSLPIPALSMLILGLWIADLRTPYESRALMVLLNIFITLPASLVICGLMTRSFMTNGQPGLLMFGCGSLIWGFTSLTAAAVVDQLNATITIHNMGVLAAALCHAAGLLWQGQLSRRKTWLNIGYAVSLGVAALIIWTALTGMAPLFFVQGQGGTPVRQTVLLSAVVIFAMVAWQMLSKLQRQAVFYHWYGLGLGLVAVGLAGVFLLTVQASILGWVNRLTQYLGSAYLLAAAFASAREAGNWKLSFAAVEEAWQRRELLTAFREEPVMVLILRYCAAFVAAAAGFGIPLAVETAIGPGLPPFITLYPAIMLTAVIGGFGPGVLATAVTLFVISVGIAPPIGQLTVSTPVQRVTVAVVGIMGFLMSAVAGLYRFNRDRAAALEYEESLRNARLENETLLRGNEAVLQAFLEQSPLGLALLDNSGRIVKANSAYRQFVPQTIPSRDLPGLPRWSSWDEQGQRILPADYPVERALRGENVVPGMEMLFTDDKGREIWTQITAVPFRSQDGEVTGAISVIQNIDTVKRTGETLKKREARLRLATSAAKLGVFEWNVQTDSAIWENDRMYGIFGLPPGSEAVNRKKFLQETVHPDDLLRFETDIEESMRAGGLFVGSYRIRRLDDGALRWIEYYSRFEKGADGKVTRLLGVLEDITERKQAESEQQQLTVAVQQERDRLSALVNSITDEIWFADADKNLTLVNPAVWKEFGLTIGDDTMIEKVAALFEVYRPDGTPRPINEAPPLRALGGETVIGQEEIVRTPARGELRHRQVNAAPVRDSHGAIIGSVSVVSDITERKAAEAALRENDRSLQDARKAAINLMEDAVEARGLLEQEVKLRKTAQEKLSRANEQLEQRIEERTAKLTSMNAELEQEIYQREDAEKRLLRLNKLYSMLTRVNEAIVRLHEPATLYELVCRIIVDSGLIKMAWIGILDTGTRQLIPVVKAGDTKGYLNDITVSASDRPDGRGPTGRAAAENRYAVCSDTEKDPSVLPWRDRMRMHGFRSSAAFPLRKGREVIGVLTCYSETPHFFGEEEVALFSSLADDISFAMDAMSAEQKRDEAEQALRTTTAEITDLYNNAPCGYHSLDREGRIIRINDTELSWLGYSREEVLGRKIADFYSAKSVELFNQHFPQFMLTGRVSNLDFELIRKNGTLMPVAVDATAVLGGDGEFLMSRSTMYDMTERKEQEKAADASSRVLKLFAGTLSRKDYLNALGAMFRSWCECSSVGIRLIEEEGKIPFIAHSGFSSAFLERESCLTLDRDVCACTRVIGSQFVNSEKGFVSADGSFVCNDTAAMTSGPDKSLYRTACAAEGYKSVAIIPISYRDNVIGALHLADYRAQAFGRSMIELIERVTPLIGEALQRFSIEEELKESKGQLQAFSAYLQSAIEEERTRIAREIHDELGQVITAAGMELSQMKKRHAEIPALKVEIASVIGTLDHAVADIQKICEELRPPVLNHLGLPTAIRRELAAFSTRTGIQVSADIIDDLQGLADSSAVACFRIFQEALTNVARHSKATGLAVLLGAEKEGVLLQIRDNGRGIARQKLNKSTSLGLIGMRERAREAGGSVTFSGGADSGAIVTARIPYRKETG